jgi:hypothetical protein
MTNEPKDGAESDRHERDEREGRVERAVREVVRKVLEAGYEKLSGGPENVRDFVREMKLPKEALGLLLAQLDETKTGVYRVVAKEVRDFLEHSNLADELARVLTTLSFEIKTEVRFIPNDARPGARPVPDVRSKVNVKRSSRPPPPAEHPTESSSQPGEALEQIPPSPKPEPSK